LAGFGVIEKWAIETAVADRNAEGAVVVDGKKSKFRVVLLDDKSDANVAASNVDTLTTKDKAAVVIGPITPTVGNAAALAAERRGVPYLESGNPLEPFRAVKEDWRWAWDFFFSGVDASNAAFAIFDDLGIKTNKQVALCTDNSPDGPVFLGGWQASAKQYGWKIVLEDTHPANSTEFGSLIEKLKSSGADYVIVLGDTPTLVAMRKQMDAADYTPKALYMARGSQLEQFAEALGPLSDGVNLESYWPPEVPYPGAAELAKRYEEETGQTFGQMLGLEYTAAQIVMDAIEKAGTTDPSKVNEAIGQTSGTFVGGPVKFDAPNHTSVTPIIWSQWQGSELKMIWPKDVANAEMVYPMP
jgi:branched-chain amino acid transport system substrate-binding protein